MDFFYYFFIIYQAFVTAHTQALLHGQFPVHLLSTDKQNIKIEKRMVIYHTFHVIWRENAEVNYRLTDN